MKKRQLIAMLSCLAVGMAGFAGVYTTEKARNDSELEQQAKEQEEQEAEKSQQASTIVPPKPQKSADTDKKEKAADTESTENTESTESKEKGTEKKQTSAPAKTAPKAAETATDDALHFKPQDGMRWPLEGNVLLDYSMDHTIYFPTLEQYQYNPALVIAGDVNSKVYLAAKGKIVDISTNEETGCTVTEDLGDGYTAIYGQLKELNFEAGDTVERGQVIGYVSEPTKYYSVEGSNLYFAMEKDGEPINPIEYFE